MRGPVQARGGHTALPNELLAMALAELTAEQFRLLVGIFYEAEFKPEGATAGLWRVPFGHALISYEGLSTRFGLSVDAVRRALRRFERIGIVTRRAEAA
ncbi:MAG: helix-turn-helix domain-containing protein, partial [Anaeromyxobacteraceae bacterium]|nr:helix-turn-helix domain-containing protein [Anaeromyxobacteraceae bacterium]